MPGQSSGSGLIHYSEDGEHWQPLGTYRDGRFAEDTATIVARIDARLAVAATEAEVNGLLDERSLLTNATHAP